MEGSNLKRVSLVTKYLLFRPQDAVRWLRERVNYKTAFEQGLPWMSWKAIEFFEKNIKKSMRIFEWGGGGSTIYFVAKGCKVTTVESNEKWRESISATIEKLMLPGLLHIRFIPAETKDPHYVREYINSVEEGGPWDVIIVDGLERDYISRVDCIPVARDNIKPGGFLVVDDAYRGKYSSIPSMLQGWTRIAMRGLGPGRLGVTQTDIYIAPDRGFSK